jgi:Sel1 repeat
MEPEKPTPGPTSRLSSAGPQHSSRSSPDGSRGQGPYTRPPRAAKPKRRWVPILAIGAVLGAGAVGAHYYSGVHGNVTPISAVATSTQQTLTLSGADLDEAATAAAITAIKSGQNDNPLIAKLTDQQKQEIVSGQRKFYKLPIAPPQANQPAPHHVPNQPASHPAPNTPATAAAHHPQHKPASHPLPQPAPLQTVATQPETDTPANPTPQDRIQITLDGAVYGTYNITGGPFTLDAPLKLGDTLIVTCLELSSGKSSITVGIATVLNPVQAVLTQGQSANFSVSPHANAQDYSWFEAQANSGNPVAEYGLGHMYQYGIGVPQDTSQAIHWYQQAANQNYLDAEQRLAELGQ